MSAPGTNQTVRFDGDLFQDRFEPMHLAGKTPVQLKI